MTPPPSGNSYHNCYTLLMNKSQIKERLRRVVAAALEKRVQRLISERKLKVVAVTGSVGKTSTKLAIAAVLRQKYRVLAHPGNYNSEIGLPMSIFEMDVPARLFDPFAWVRILRRIDRRLAKPFPYDVLVLEMGADAPGDVTKFMRYIRPDIGIVTAIAPAHIEQFGSVDRVAEEKMALARGSRSVLLNAEDPRVMREAKALGGPIQTYGVHAGGVCFQGITRNKQLRLSGRLQLHNGEVAVRTNFVGEHSLAALACAGAVGEDLGLDLGEIRQGIEDYRPVTGRMQVLEGVNGSMIIDDTYNSSPRATIAALQTLKHLPGRHIAVLGSMNELGDLSDDAHREVGRAAADVDLLITIGTAANRHLAHTAVKSGLALDKAHPFLSPYSAGEYLRSQLRRGDVVLAKGSQNGVFAEEAIAMALADPADKSKLVRQSKEWQDKKHKQFIKD